MPLLIPGECTLLRSPILQRKPFSAYAYMHCTRWNFLGLKAITLHRTSLISTALCLERLNEYHTEFSISPLSNASPPLTTYHLHKRPVSATVALFLAHAALYPVNPIGCDLCATPWVVEPDRDHLFLDRNDFNDWCPETLTGNWSYMLNTISGSQHIPIQFSCSISFRVACLRSRTLTEEQKVLAMGEYLRTYLTCCGPVEVE